MRHLGVCVNYLQDEVITCEFSEEVSYKINTDSGSQTFQNR